MRSANFTENVLDAPFDERVTNITLLEAIQNGAADMAAIRAATNACTIERYKAMSPCHRCCSRDIQKLIDNQPQKEERPS